MRIAILGGGISGLALGHFLRDDERIDYCVFEAAPVAGGLCRSKLVQGFTYDEAGGHILYSKDRETLELMRSAGGSRGGMVETARQTAIRWRDRYVHYPFENGIGDLPPQARYDCLKGYLDAARSRAAQPQTPESFDEWIRWRFGAGIAEHFMEPYNRKIWCYGLDQISSSWVAGRVPDAPIDDVIRAACQLRTEGYTHQSVFYFPREGGFQTIADGFAERSAGRLRTATPVERVECRGAGFAVNGEAFDLVVNTLPLPLLAERLPALSEEGRRAISGLRWLGLTTVLLALDRPQLEPRSWIYLPFPEQGPANRVTFFSNYSPGNAPPGKSSMMAEVTWPKEEAPRADEELTERVVAGMEASGLVSREELLFTDATTRRFAYIVFDLDFDRNIRAAVESVEALGIETFGRFGRFEYLNSDGCVMRARAMAERIRARLDGSTAP